MNLSKEVSELKEASFFMGKNILVKQQYNFTFSISLFG